MKKSVYTALQITVHYTRASKTRLRGSSFPGIPLVPGRPRFCKVLESVIARASALGAGEKDAEAITGVFVGVCGPVGLRDEIAEVVRNVDGEKREKVGGVELFEEYVGFLCPLTFPLTRNPGSLAGRISFEACRMFLR
jgi:ferric-chelate reductase